MKKKILITLLTFSCLFTNAQAETYLRDFFEVRYDESLQKEAFPINKELSTKYQNAAKTFAKKASTKTSIVTYETLDNGVLVHIGWYADGCIVTALNGLDVGKQVIVVDDYVVDISYYMETHSKYFTHKYTWAKVTSYSNKQILKAK